MVKSLFWVEAVSQTLIAIFVGIFSIFVVSDVDRSFVLVVIGLYLIVCNLSNYFGYVFQAVNETKLFSYSIMIERLVFLVPLAVLLIARCTSFEPYVLAYLFSKICSLAYCLLNARDFLSAPCRGCRIALMDAWGSIRVGIKLMIANIASTLIIGIVRFVVDAYWDIDTFSRISFAFTLTSFVLAFVSQVSMVLFPALRQVEVDKLRDTFRRMLQILSLVLPAAYLLYFPVKWVLGIWLPGYAESLILFALLLPICVYDGEMNLIGTTFFKVLRQENSLLKINLVCVAGSFVVSLVAATVGSVEMMLLACALIVSARSIYSSCMLERNLSVTGATRLHVLELLVTITAMLSAYLSKGDVFGFAIAAVAYGLYLCLAVPSSKRIRLA